MDGSQAYTQSMATVLHLPVLCGDLHVDEFGVHACVETVGHEAHGLTHLAADGVEWLDRGLDGGYVAHGSDRPVPSARVVYEMAQAS